MYARPNKKFCSNACRQAWYRGLKKSMAAPLGGVPSQTVTVSQLEKRNGKDPASPELGGRRKIPAIKTEEKEVQ